MTSSRPLAFRRFCAAVVAAALVLQPLGAYAAPNDITPQLANVPLQGLNPVHPNIMFTMDDSGSMAFATLPDYISDGASNSWCLGFVGGVDGYAVKCALSPDPAPITTPPLASSNLNHIYYDPAIIYFPGVRGDGTDPNIDAKNLPCEATDTAGNECNGPFTAVYTDGFAGYPGSNTSTTTDLTRYPDEVFCSVPSPTSADVDTRNTNGSICRYNGVIYGGVGGYLYPNASFPYQFGGRPDAYCKTTTPTAADLATATITGTGGGSICRYSGVAYGPGAGTVFRPPSAIYSNLSPAPLVGNPYYYTISVQFCATPDGKGWGTGSCASRWSTTNRYVSYSAGSFVRHDINPSDAAQMRNFATWYTFARTRLLAMKTAGGLGFTSSALIDKTRIGFNTLNSYALPAPGKFLNVKKFDVAYRTTWFKNFYSATASSSTPSINAMWLIGQYFSNQSTTGSTQPALPGAVDPALADPGEPPDAGKCRPNYHFMATDGYWNQAVQSLSGRAGPIGDADDKVPALPGPVTGFTPGQSFPLPYREGTGQDKMSDTMSDIAMYYWINDLRPDLPDKVQDSIAPWQHVVFYGLALGAEGTLPYPSGINDVTSGATPWPGVPVPPPSPPTISNTARAIDDFWHAAVNSRGKYFNAQSAQQLAEGIVSALGDFTAQEGTATAVGLVGAQLTATKSFGYRTSYEKGWWGDVRKYALDPNTGALPVNPVTGNPLNAPVWSATDALDAQAAGTGWKNRRIVTYDGAVGVAFKYTNLSGSEQASLIAGWNSIAPAPVPTGDDIVNYLRGDQSNEGVGLSNFRTRSHILGDIVGSGAVPVGAPSQPYTDTGNPGYTAFASSKSSRPAMVYVGSNDAMLHAFIDTNTVDAGKEAWAFVPKALFSSGDPNDSTHPPSHRFQPGALSYRLFGLKQAVFKHQNYVNATPRVWDIDIANTGTATPPTSGNQWRTILVGGLGSGGRAVYALDVTDPVTLADAESVAASKVMWEFTDTNLGYVYDAPTLVKTSAYGWVALVVSGYNNPGGKGFLYVLNAKTGKLVHPVYGKIPLPGDTGTSAEPTGLSTVRAYTASRRDPYVLQAYSGDLKGNIWRFDLSSADASNWKAERLATLTDGSNPQPITTGVRVEIDQNNNIDRYLFVGTGKLLSESDLKDNSVRNSLYVIKDGNRTTPEPAPSTPYRRNDLNAVNAGGIPGFSGIATGRGWYMDALDPAEKIVTDVFADVQTVVGAFSKPSDDPCGGLLTSSLFARDFTTGNSVLQSAGGAVVASIDDIGAIAGVALIQGQSAGNASAAGDVRAQVTTMKGQVFSFGVKLAGSPSLKHRVSWRLLNRN